MNKAVEEVWEGYKDATKERRFRKFFPRLKKKDLEQMSLHDILESVIAKTTGKEGMFDRPLGTFSDEEWEELNERMDKRARKLAQEMGFDFDVPEKNTPLIYGEEQN